MGNRLYNRPGQSNNLVRQNLLKRTSDVRNDRSTSNSAAKNQLLKTTPNITPVPPRKTDYKPPARPVVSSHQIGANNTNNRSQNLRSTGPNRFNNTTKSNDSSSIRSASNDVKKREFSPAEKERQKQAMDRLAGKGRTATNVPSGRNNSGNKPNSNVKPPLHSYRTRI